MFQDIETGLKFKRGAFVKLDIGRLKFCVSFSFQVLGIVGLGD